MASVQDEINRQHGGGGPRSDDEILDAAFAKAAKGGSPKARTAPEAPRARGKRASHHEPDRLWTRTSLEPTGRRTAEGAPIARLSGEALQSFLSERGSNSVADDLT